MDDVGGPEPSGSEIDPTAGRNLRRLRRQQGLSLDQLAGRTALSKSFLSRLENGKRELRSRANGESLAAALGCGISDITGQPSGGSLRRPVAPAVPALRRVLQAIDLDAYRDDPVLPLEDLAARGQALWEARRRADHDAVGRALPGLLRDVHVHVQRGPEQREAGELALQVASAATFTLKALNEADLAWTAGSYCIDLADRLGDPAAAGFAAYSRAHATAVGFGYEGLLVIAEQAADALRPRLGTTSDGLDAYRVYGSLLLTAALGAATARGRQPLDVYYSEAASLAERVGDSPPAGDRWQTYFGPSNAVIWRMTVEADAGAGGRVAELAAEVDLGVLDSRSRRASYWTELGRGLAQVRTREEEAADALLQADRMNPRRVRASSYVRDAVDVMLSRRINRPAVRRKLETLTRRLRTVV